MNTRPTQPAAEPRDESAADTPPRRTSRELLGEHDELLIEHEEQLYRLRRTATGKLILTK